MSGVPGPTLPREPLVEAMRSYYLRHRYDVDPHGPVGEDAFFAHLTGLDKSWLRRIRRGRQGRLAVPTADRIATAMGLPLSWIYNGDGDD